MNEKPDRISLPALEAIKDASQIIYQRRIDGTLAKLYMDSVIAQHGAEAGIYVGRLVDVLDTLGDLGVLNTEPEEIAVAAMVEMGRREKEENEEKSGT